MLQGRMAGSGRNGLPELKPYIYRGADKDDLTPHLHGPPVRVRPPGWREQANARARAKRAADPEWRAREAARHRAWRERQGI